jgi:hypothetical protein
MKRARHESTIERKVEFRRTVRLVQRCCGNLDPRAFSVEALGGSKYITETTRGITSPHHCVIMKRPTSKSCVPSVMVGCTGPSSAGPGSTQRASVVEVRNEHITQTDTAHGAYPTWRATKARKGIVHARTKVRERHVDELFFSDLPTQQEREDILRIHIKKFGREPDQFDVGAIAGQALDFSGAELAQVVVDALYWAFQRDREPNTQDLVDAVRRTNPLSKTMPERIESVREWAKGRAVPANLRSETVSVQPARQFLGRA